MSTRRDLLVSMLAVVAVSACGAPPDGGDIAVSRSALRSFQPWQTIPNGVVLLAPAVAASNSAGVTLFAIGTDYQAYTTNNNQPGGFGVPWKKISTFAMTPGSTKTPTVAAAGFLSEPTQPGFLGNFFAVAYVNPLQFGQVYIRIQNQDASNVIHDWDPIPSPGFIDSVAIAWAPRNAVSGPARQLIAIGTPRSGDIPANGDIYIATNSLANGLYNHANWTPFRLFGSSIPNGPYPYSPAIVWACPRTAGAISLVMAVQHGRSPLSTYPEALYSTFTSTKGWGPWTLAQNGLFIPGQLGLAAACTEFQQEVSLFGVGTDNHAYVTTQITGNSTTWSQIGNLSVALGQEKQSLIAAGSSAGLVWATSDSWTDLTPQITSALAP